MIIVIVRCFVMHQLIKLHDCCVYRIVLSCSNTSHYIITSLVYMPDAL